MSEHLKQRIVGAVVLISLAVIFLPMLLDGAGQKRDSFEENPIPEKPDFNFKPLEIPLNPVRAESKPARVIEHKNQTQVVVTKNESSPEQPSTAQSLTPLPPPSEEGDRLIDAWIVQVGSFSSVDNAFALRDKLRSKKLNAFVDEVTSGDGKHFYRVRVGPYKLRLEADAAQNLIHENHKISGKVMKHP